jgi:hypothetical protein
MRAHCHQTSEYALLLLVELLVLSGFLAGRVFATEFWRRSLPPGGDGVLGRAGRTRRAS